MTLADHILAVVDRHTGVSVDEIGYQLARRQILATGLQIIVAVGDLVDQGTLEPRAGCRSSIYYARAHKVVAT